MLLSLRAEVTKGIRLAELSLTNSEFANGQKLGYFGLAQSLDGKWKLTGKGVFFLGNHIEVEKFVFTKGGKVVDTEGTIRISEVDAGWSDRYQYAREARRA